METLKNVAYINTLLPFLLTFMFILSVGVVLLYQHFQKNLFTQKLKNEVMKNNHQRELLHSNILAQEEERKSIAQDIHDELGAALSITRMNIVMLRQRSHATAQHLEPDIHNVLTLVEAALASTRSISHRLMPPQLETFGLVKTLEAVTAQINKTGEVHIQLSASHTFEDMPWTASLGLYRILMELINNTVKHSGASQVAIEFAALKNYIVCRYQDNGIGFTPGKTSRGLGYKNIEGRINSLQGTFEFSTGKRKGFRAEITIPFNSKNHPDVG